jgi:hypothetical protein
LARRPQLNGKSLARQAVPMDVIARICGLPAQFKARGDVSVSQLVEESGYLAAPADLTVESVSTYLREHPELIEAWFGYSEDKRTSSGWYVVERPRDTFEVGEYPKGDRISIAGRASACAEFIVREIRSIAG